MSRPIDGGGSTPGKVSSRTLWAAVVTLALLAIAIIWAVRFTAMAHDAAPPPARASDAGQDVSTAAIIAHPEAFEPFSYALVVRSLWESGRRRQAAFWFYVFQERTRPWADADQRGDGAAALRGALNDKLGTLINGWLGSDLGAWQTIVGRAMEYEAKLPLNAARPAGLSKPVWEAKVAQARRDYVAGARQTLFTLHADDVARQRRQAGLYVGPLQDPGPALPDEWR